MVCSCSILTVVASLCATDGHCGGESAGYHGCSGEAAASPQAQGEGEHSLPAVHCGVHEQQAVGAADFYSP